MENYSFKWWEITYLLSFILFSFFFFFLAPVVCFELKLVSAV